MNSSPMGPGPLLGLVILIVGVLVVTAWMSRGNVRRTTTTTPPQSQPPLQAPPEQAAPSIISSNVDRVRQLLQQHAAQIDELREEFLKNHKPGVLNITLMFGTPMQMSRLSTSLQEALRDGLTKEILARAHEISASRLRKSFMIQCKCLVEDLGKLLDEAKRVSRWYEGVSGWTEKTAEEALTLFESVPLPAVSTFSIDAATTAVHELVNHLKSRMASSPTIIHGTDRPVVLDEGLLCLPMGDHFLEWMATINDQQLTVDQASMRVLIEVTDLTESKPTTVYIDNILPVEVSVHQYCPDIRHINLSGRRNNPALALASLSSPQLQ